MNNPHEVSMTLELALLIASRAEVTHHVKALTRKADTWRSRANAVSTHPAISAAVVGCAILRVATLFLNKAPQTKEKTMNEHTRPLENLKDKLEPKFEEAKHELAKMNGKATKFIQANPGACLLGAVAIGFAIGQLASRR